MKYFFLMALVTISTISLAQKSIIGKWKIVSIDNGEIYYNFQKDSLLISPEFSKTNLDSMETIQIKSTVKQVYGNTKFSFDKNGNYKWQCIPFFEAIGKFSVDEKKQTIKMDGENSLREIITDEFPYQIKNNQLEITISFSVPPGKYLLEKI